MGFRSSALELANLNPQFNFLPLNGYKRPIVAWKENHPDGFSIEQCLEYPNCQAIGVLIGINLVCIDYDGESSIDFAGKNNIDFTHQTWHVKRDSYKGLFRFKALYSPTVSQIEQLPYGEFENKQITKNASDDSKREALELFCKFPRYAVVLGKHPSGDNYYSPKGYGFENLTSPPKETWDLFVDFAYRKGEPPQTKKTLTRGSWEKIKDVCPICGRDKQHYCSISKDRNTIRCFHGVTYYPPTLKKGELVSGVWAFSSISDNSEGHTFSNFVRHKEKKFITNQSIRRTQMERKYG